MIIIITYRLYAEIRNKMLVIILILANEKRRGVVIFFQIYIFLSKTVKYASFK